MKLSSLAVFAMAILTPACCTNLNAARNAENQAQDVVDKTTALVKYVTVAGQNSAGETIYEEVGKDDAGAMLKPYCTATWISKDVMLTAAHCVANIGRPPITPEQAIMHMLLGAPLPPWDPTGQPMWYSVEHDVRNVGTNKYRSSRGATVLAFDDSVDLALVKATPVEGDVDAIPEHPIAHLASHIYIGEKLQIVGHPIGMWWSYYVGTLASIRPGLPNADEKEVDSLQISAPVYFGNSGGGAFDENGDLVGVCSYIRKAPNMAFYINRTVAWDMMRAAGITVP